MNIKKLTLSVSFVLTASILPSLLSVTPLTDINTVYAEQTTKRVPALRNKVYSQLARAQKLADDGQVQEGLQALDEIKARSSSMNAYEVAMMYNFYGFIYYNENQLDKAIESFEMVIAEEQIPESLKQSTTFSLAQLAMANNDYEKVIVYLDKWKLGNTKPIANSYYVLRANAHYLQKQYQEAIESINVAINLAESEGEVPKENWLVLQRALYYSLNQPEQVVAVLEKMVKLFNKPEYWVQLGGMYGEVGEAKKQLVIFEAAKQQGFIKLKNEIM
jgi:tetratricopeptide (TPR) repeat protein